MSDIISIVGYITNNQFRGQIAIEEAPFKELCFEGENKIMWSEKVFTKILDNEQIDTNSFKFQILLFSDVKQDRDLFSSISNLTKNISYWEDVVKAAEVWDLRPYKWVIDSKELQPEVQASLPTSKHGKIIGYIYSLSELRIPDKCKPWPGNQTSIPVTLPNTRKLKEPEQILAKQQAPGPKPVDGTDLYDALRVESLTPKN